MKYKSEKENNKEESSIESLLRSVVAGRVISFFRPFSKCIHTYGQKNETKKKPYEVADNHHAATQSEHNACALSIWLLLLLLYVVCVFFSFLLLNIAFAV